MFEKEAEEYATIGYEKKLLTKEQITVLKCGRYDGFRKGAEFGYNRFVKESTKEDLAKKILEIIESNNTDWETINMVACLCKSVIGGVINWDTYQAN